MFTPKGYTDKTAVENYLLQTIDYTFDDQIDDWIAAVEQYIDNLTSRPFAPLDDEVSERLYDGDGSRFLIVDAFTSTDEDPLVLKIGDTVIEDTEYLLEPYNQEGKYQIRLISDRFIRGNANVSVTALWGGIPADLRLAATILVAGICNASMGVNTSNVKSETIGRYSVTYGDTVGYEDHAHALKIIEMYKKYSF